MSHSRTDRRLRLSASGFTLVETIAVITVLAVIGSMVSMLLLTSSTGYHDASVQGQLHVETSSALDRVVREFRQIEAVDDGQGSLMPDITSAAENAIAWSTDSSLSVNGDQQLILRLGGTDSVLATDVTALALDYLDGTASSLLSGGQVPNGSLPDIRRLSISLTVTRSGLSDTLHTRLFLRSVMEGTG
ncbi:MAG: prepilin-type N-terminal cleavage/methylation domain-containing protein [Planctomycetes bacterium]|nr:prepilin-type N-terminal cleavage/methylation domain-containing protein [Planctomycetota bacterium]NOG54678.1 prepilin-type N-terminal cleavage/methylation domain-containing protein [Planctomycetota bacterium]